MSAKIALLKLLSVMHNCWEIHCKGVNLWQKANRGPSSIAASEESTFPIVFETKLSISFPERKEVVLRMKCNGNQLSPTWMNWERVLTLFRSAWG